MVVELGVGVLLALVGVGTLIVSVGLTAPPDEVMRSLTVENLV